MHVEPRGKYPGAKVHLNEKECVVLLAGKTLEGFEGKPLKKLLYSLQEALVQLQTETPTLLAPRTEAEIKAELINERDKATAKLKAMEAGNAWNSGKSKA